MVSLEEVHQASQSPDLGHWIVAADLMRDDITPLRPDDRLDRALELFVENDLPALPVVDKYADGRIIGIVKRSDVATTYLRHVHEVGGNSKDLVGTRKPAEPAFAPLEFTLQRAASSAACAAALA